MSILLYYCCNFAISGESRGEVKAELWRSGLSRGSAYHIAFLRLSRGLIFHYRPKSKIQSKELLAFVTTVLHLLPSVGDEKKASIDRTVHILCYDTNLNSY